MSAESANLNLAPCPSCGGTGWELVEGRGVRPCRCQKPARMQRLYARAKIPTRYQAKGFDDFDAHCPSLKRALMHCRKFVADFPLVDAGLLFLGSVGVGKTHLVIGILKALIEKLEINGLFYDYRDLLKEIQDSYNPNTHTSELKILAPVFEAEILVLDELGAARPTDWVQETMTQIITKRYNDKKITIFTSNYVDMPIATIHAEFVAACEDQGARPALLERAVGQVMGLGYPESRAKQIVLFAMRKEGGCSEESVRRAVTRLAFDEPLEERIGERLRSRLREMCKVIYIESNDYRKEIEDKRRGLKFT